MTLVWVATVGLLGAVPDVAPVAEFVADSVRRREPFTLSLGGGGAFPDPRRASVLWLGARDRFEWDRADESGARAPAGVYMVRAHRGGETRDSRFVLLH